MIKSGNAKRSNRTKRVLWAASASLAATPLLALLPASARASDLYWDVNGSTPDSSGSNVATGTWDGVNAFFNDDPNGGAGNFTANPSATDNVIFAAGANATGAYTVTLSISPTVGSLTVEEGTIQQSGGTLSIASGAVSIANGASWSCAGAGGQTLGGTAG